MLIKKVESILLDSNSIIKSPDYIIDKITGNPREVDVSVRSRIGSSEILIIIECRDRSGVEDITWIEQVKTKTQDLNANKVIAVSSSGFSENAASKAKHYGIEVRTYKEIDLAEIKNWFAIDNMIVHAQNYLIHNVKIEFENSNIEDEKLLNGKSVSDIFLIRTRDLSEVNLKSALEGVLEENNVWEHIPKNDTLHRKTINVIYDNPLDRFQVQTTDSYKQIISIEFLVDLKIEVKLVPIYKASSYKNENGEIAQTIDFIDVMPDKNQILQFILSNDGALSISFDTLNTEH